MMANIIKPGEGPLYSNPPVNPIRINGDASRATISNCNITLMANHLNPFRVFDLTITNPNLKNNIMNKYDIPATIEYVIKIPVEVTPVT